MGEALSIANRYLERLSTIGSLSVRRLSQEVATISSLEVGSGKIRGLS
jgi:hypothetical protein